ncbi:hypothetical protein HQ576_19135, partial [bacterium]|nr:hypothetical protein [bacterium]
MLACVYLALALAVMVVLMRLRVAVGYALTAGAAAVALLFGTPWSQWPHGFGAALGGVAENMGRAAIEPEGLQLLGLVLLITF